MNKKELAAMCTAILTIVCGHVLAFLCYFQYEGEIHDSVQWYFSQCLIYAGSFFGISTYVHFRLRNRQ